VAQKFKTGIVLEELAAASTQALGIKVDLDSEARVKIDDGGKITWGTGSATGDTTLYRSAANTLKTDDAFQAVAGVINLTTDGTPSAASADGTIAIDTTNNQFYYRSSGTWTEVVSQSTTVADGGTSAAWVRYHIDADGNDSTGN
jgi:hypothetical protein